MSEGKRLLLAKQKGYLNAAKPQSRFILFLLLLLVSYTLLLRVFQKLAEIVGLPVFIPISLFSLLIFIGIAGTLYSHKFIGPMHRIRQILEQMAEGDMSFSLKLRETDDPSIKALASAISAVCEHSRNSHALIQSGARELFEEIRALSGKVMQGVEHAELRGQIERILKKQELLDKAITSYRNA